LWSQKAADRGRESVAKAIEPYASALLDPFQKSCPRYPDETILPTAMMHLTSTINHTFQGVGSNNALITALNIKPIQESVPAPSPYSAPASWTIRTPTEFPAYPAPGATYAIVQNTDYGPQQASFVNVSSIDRTLAAGIKVSLTGLPPSTFLPSGTIYMLQLQETEFDYVWQQLGNVGEAYAIQAVAAGKGFSLSTAELQSKRSAHIPYLPQGPMSFNFTDTNSFAAAFAGAANDTLTAIPPSSVVSAAPKLVLVAFGMQSGITLRIEYSHHVEYVPFPNAAGLIQTENCPPSSVAREAIARTLQTASSNINGKSSLMDNPVIMAGAAAAGALARAGVGLIPGGRTVASIANFAAKTLGAPMWLQGALSSLT